MSAFCPETSSVAWAWGGGFAAFFRGPALLLVEASPRSRWKKDTPVQGAGRGSTKNRQCLLFSDLVVAVETGFVVPRARRSVVGARSGRLQGHRPLLCAKGETSTDQSGNSSRLSAPAATSRPTPPKKELTPKNPASVLAARCPRGRRAFSPRSETIVARPLRLAPGAGPLMFRIRRATTMSNWTRKDCRAVATLSTLNPRRENRPGSASQNAPDLIGPGSDWFVHNRRSTAPNELGPLFASRPQTNNPSAEVPGCFAAAPQAIDATSAPVGVGPSPFPRQPGPIEPPPRFKVIKGDTVETPAKVTVGLVSDIRRPKKILEGLEGFGEIVRCGQPFPGQLRWHDGDNLKNDVLRIELDRRTRLMDSNISAWSIPESALPSIVFFFCAIILLVLGLGHYSTSSPAVTAAAPLGRPADIFPVILPGPPAPISARAPAPSLKSPGPPRPSKPGVSGVRRRAAKFRPSINLRPVGGPHPSFRAGGPTTRPRRAQRRPRTPRPTRVCAPNLAAKLQQSR